MLITARAYEVVVKDKLAVPMALAKSVAVKEENLMTEAVVAIAALTLVATVAKTPFATAEISVPVASENFNSNVESSFKSPIVKLITSRPSKPVTVST